MIKVYSANWCTGCKAIKKVLNSKGITFIEVDIDTLEGMKEAKELNIRAIPITVVGDKRFVGSKPETIADILGALDDQNNNSN